MSRRASRTLIGVLSVTTIIGLSAYAIAHRKAPAKGSTMLAATGESPTTPTTKPAKDEKLVAKPTEPTIKQVKPEGETKADTKSKAQLAMAISKAAPTGTLAEGKAKIDAGELTAGRRILNDALLSGQLSEPDAREAKKLISDANQTLIFSTRPVNDDLWTTSHVVKTGELLQKIARDQSVTSELLLRVNGIGDARRLRAGATIKVINGPFHAVVTKHAFTMDVYLGGPAEKGSEYITTYPVGLGRDDSTPAGAWIVEQRVPNPKYYSPRGEGTIEAGDPKNPLGKFWIALTGTDGAAVGKQSYGIHGNIDPDSIGKQSSMGCIRMRNDDIAIVYELLVPGKSTVVVKD